MADILQTTFSESLSWLKLFYLIQISLKFKDLIDNKPELSQIIAWSHTSDKLLSEPILP